MKSFHWLSALLLAIVTPANAGDAGAVPPSGVAEKDSSAPPWFLSEWRELHSKSPREASLAWFDQTRLGMFVHWGVWGKYHRAWAMFADRIPLDEYQRAAREVDASGFDAAGIVRLAKDSGMNYLTFVAKHHDGFCLWDSKATGFDSMDYPMHRDFVRELAEECRKQKLPLMIYYSLGIDWTHPYFLPRELYAQARPAYKETPGYFKYREPADFGRYRDFCKAQLTELCTGYGPIAGFWFDPLGGVLANAELFKVQEFYDLIHQHQPHALIHFKTGATGTEDVLVGERKLESISSYYQGDSPEKKRIRDHSEAAWRKNFRKKAEIAVTSQGTWEWSPGSRCLPPDGLWKMLEGAANNNANLLLNFGPKPDGSIPGDVAMNFRALGERIRKDGYPSLNRTTYLELRGKGHDIDTGEKEKTSR
jgi:alpha-L-fucosidase